MLRYPLSLIALLLVALPGAAPAQEKKRPNILFCFADDWGRYASILAEIDRRPSINDAVRTPNIDRVAREGVVFRNAFVNSPSCTPCRSALLSGRYFFKTGRGAILNGAVWDSSIPTFPLLLRDAGYHIGKSYKVWSPGTPADAPFDGQKHGYEKAGRDPNSFSEVVTAAIKRGEPFETARDRVLEQVRGNFDAFLSDRKEDKPWLYFFGATNTHRTWIKGSGKALWNIEPESLKGKLPSFLPDVPEIREDLADYLGEVQAWDAYIGVLLKRLEETGEFENTIIVISGDHGAPGFPGGKCNLYDFGSGVMLTVRMPGTGNPPKQGLRVVDDIVGLMDLMPTFLEAGGVQIPANVNGRSLMPILTSGKSGQVDPDRTFVVTGRERHVASAREENRPYPMRGIRTGEFLYIRNFEPDRWPMGSPGEITETSAPKLEALATNTRLAFADMDASPTKAWLIDMRNNPQWKRQYDYAFGKRPGEELYDLRKDPDQLTNVAADPAYSAKKKELSDRLTGILTANGDPRVVDGGTLYENPPFTDAADANRRPARR
jgi:N-sulfoglucosamine sulfohydrolase